MQGMSTVLISCVLAAFLSAAPAAGGTGTSLSLDSAHLYVVVIAPSGAPPKAKVEAALAKFAAKDRSSRFQEVEPQKLRMFRADSLPYTASRLTEAERAKVAKEKSALLVVFSWSPADPSGLGAAYSAAESASPPDAFFGDAVTETVLSVKDWKERREHLPPGAAPDVRSHIVVRFVSEEDGSVLLVTGGLDRFGLREVALSGASRSSARSARDMLNLLAQRLLEGGRPSADGKLVLRIADVQSEQHRKALRERTFPNAKQEATIVLRASPDPEDPVRVEFPRAPSDPPSTGVEPALRQLFGWEDSAAREVPDGEMMAVSAKARTRAISEFKPKVQEGLPPGHILLVKAPFEYEGGTEFMWVEVQSWKGALLRGVLQSQPERAKVQAGQIVEVEEKDIFDFTHELPDGTFEGNDTGRKMRPDLFEPAGEGRWRIRR